MRYLGAAPSTPPGSAASPARFPPAPHPHPSPNPAPRLPPAPHTPPQDLVHRQHRGGQAAGGRGGGHCQTREPGAGRQRTLHRLRRCGWVDGWWAGGGFGFLQWWAGLARREVEWAATLLQSSASTSPAASSRSSPHLPPTARRPGEGRHRCGCLQPPQLGPDLHLHQPGARACEPGQAAAGSVDAGGLACSCAARCVGQQAEGFGRKPKESVCPGAVCGAGIASVTAAQAPPPSTPPTHPPPRSVCMTPLWPPSPPRCLRCVWAAGWSRASRRGPSSAPQRSTG